MKKAELHNIQFKKSQIQWNPITIVINRKVAEIESQFTFSRTQQPQSKFSKYYSHITPAAGL